jgi:hypothetical protein
MFALSWILWPIPLATLVVLGARCIREKRVIEALPLLATQLNSALIWGCFAARQVGVFNDLINDVPILNGDLISLRNFIIRIFLSNMIYLEPLNMFLYTWRFLH